MRKNWSSVFVLSIGCVFTLAACALANAGGAAGSSGSCRSYAAMNDKERAALATGYLEGVQAGLGKDRSDMLVPPEHPDHPLWWLLPDREMTADRLAAALSAFCKSGLNEDTTLFQGFRDIAARKDGAPRTGLPLGDGPSDEWRQVIEAGSPTCRDYASASDGERGKLIYGYFLGAKAVGLVLGTPGELSLMVWPEVDPRDVKARVDRNCRGAGHRNSTVRDVLWLTTVEMGMERWLAGRQEKNRELLNLRNPD